MKLVINLYLLSQGLTKSNQYGNMYCLKTTHKILIITSYVDDLIVIVDNIHKISQIKKKLQTKYDMANLDFASKYLGLEAKRHTNDIYMHYLTYALTILEDLEL